MTEQVASALACSALRCQERIVIHAASPLHIDTIRERAGEAGWRHDADGDWCPWHSPEQEAATRAARSSGVVAS